MTVTQHLVRWAIPGWLSIGFLTCLVLLRKLLFEGFSLTTVFRDTFFAEISAERLIGIAGLGIPIGYVLYQLYFLGYWRSYPWRIWPLDRGGAALLGRTFAKEFKEKEREFAEALEKVNFRLSKTKIERLRKKLKDACGRELLELPEPEQRSLWWPIRLFYPRRGVFRKDTRRPAPIEYVSNLYLATFAWVQALDKMQHPDILEQRLRSLTDIFHSLGVVRVALWVAGGIYAFNELGLHWIRTGETFYIYGVLVALPVVLMGNVVLSSCRQRTLEELTFLMHDTIYFHWVRQIPNTE